MSEEPVAAVEDSGEVAASPEFESAERPTVSDEMRAIRGADKSVAEQLGVGRSEDSVAAEPAASVLATIENDSELRTMFESIRADEERHQAEFVAGQDAREELAFTRQAEVLDGAYEALADGHPDWIAASVGELIGLHGADSPEVRDYIGEWQTYDPESAGTWWSRVDAEARQLQAALAQRQIEQNNAEIARLRSEQEAAIVAEFSKFLEGRPEARSDETARRMYELAVSRGINVMDPNAPGSLSDRLAVLHEAVQQSDPAVPGSAAWEAREHERMLNARGSGLVVGSGTDAIEKFNKKYEAQGYWTDGTGYIHVRPNIDMDAVAANLRPRLTREQFSEVEGERLSRVWARPSVRGELFGQTDVVAERAARRAAREEAEASRQPSPWRDDYYGTAARYARGEL